MIDPATGEVAGRAPKAGLGNSTRPAARRGSLLEAPRPARDDAHTSMDIGASIWQEADRSMGGLLVLMILLSTQACRIGRIVNVQARARQAVSRVAILQSCYIPWKGFFDIIGNVDHFIIYDDIQYVRRHWHNRNRIMTPRGPIWITIPVNSKGKYLQNIDEVTISEAWTDKHLKTIQSCYARAPFWEQYKAWFQEIYDKAANIKSLSEVNMLFLRAICAELGIRTTISQSRDYDVEGRKTDRLLALCRAVDAHSYLSGPSAREYLEESKFAEEGIAVKWMDYSGYPEYPQLGPLFDHGVSVIDLLLNVGREAKTYMKTDI